MGRLALGLALGWAVVSCAIAGVMVRRSVKRQRKWARAVEVLRELDEGCDTPAGRLRQVADAMAVEMHAGLASDGGSKLRMLLTFVDRLPDGNERGVYYALDLGGTNFRVLETTLEGRRSDEIRHRVERQPIPRQLLTGTSEELFDFIALSLEQFIASDNRNELPSEATGELGFTFSFPVKQTSISSGFLTRWTKGFAIEGVVGEDVTAFLQQALDKRRLNIRVAALVNDTVGTLALGHYHDEDTVAAVIVGTGTNACYVERTEAIVKCQGILTNSGSMVVNMEWGNFWSSHLPRTAYDVELDLESPNPNDQGFEKMISGMYLGDIARRVILKMAQESNLFGELPSALHVPYILSTQIMAAMHEDDTPDLRKVASILQDTLQIPEVPLKARKLVVRICDVVARRAARLAAAGIVGILKKMGRDGSGGVVGVRSRSEVFSRRTVVAIEGGLYTNYTLFRDYLKEAMSDILGEELSQHVILQVTKDGSGLGAALLAATYSSGIVVGTS